MRPAEDSGPYPMEAVFEVFEDVELVAGKGGFEAVGKADEVMAFRASGCAGDDADCAARVDEGVVGAAYLDEGDDLCAGGWIFGRFHEANMGEKW
ncbi:MAG: hypothetical protein JWQ71_418 [Pedosphaera sp.]|nr:hypothetical protein [Pedosphaera sp.]